MSLKIICAFVRSLVTTLDNATGVNALILSKIIIKIAFIIWQSCALVNEQELL
jgi:hypothetical protein